MKKFFGTLTALVCIIFLLCTVNIMTDIFREPSDYVPYLEENHPELCKKISEISENVYQSTIRLPVFNKMTTRSAGDTQTTPSDDMVANNYVKSGSRLTFYPKEYIGIDVNYDSLGVYGNSGSADMAYIALMVNTESGENVSQTIIGTDPDFSFDETVSLPDDYDALSVEIFSGPAEFGSYNSWACDYIKIIKKETGEWVLKPSPALEHNLTLYEADRPLSEALTATSLIQSDDPSVKLLAEKICEDCENDYDRAAALHDWVASELYYDVSLADSNMSLPESATEIISGRRTLCLGYAVVYAALCRSMGIPCNVVSGYALDINGGDSAWTAENIDTMYENHAWNEVYTDGRWLIVDTTWDSSNTYENGEFIFGGKISHLYFDSNIEFFSVNHKIIEYEPLSR